MKRNNGFKYNLLLLVILSIGFISCSTSLIETSNSYPYFEDYRAQNFTRLNGYLTFDDFGSYDNTKKVLDVLSKYHAKATFFLNCSKYESSPENQKTLQLIINSGNTIGNHTYDHFLEGNDYRLNPLNNLGYNFPSPAYGYYTWYYGIANGFIKLRHEISDCDTINKNTKNFQKIFRPPYGEMGSSLLNALSLEGYTTKDIYLWDVDSCDWTEQTSAEEIRDSILLGAIPSFCREGFDGFATSPIRKNSVVLMHLSFGNTKTAEGLDLALNIIHNHFNFKSIDSVLRFGDKTQGTKQ
jgi:peptidoglycan/xylan/chitin deacetylase (PgdA/CDA1 family)